MDLLNKQLFEANFSAISQQFIDWKEAKPDNKKLDSLAKCLFEMYVYANQLEMKNYTIQTQVSKFRHENLELKIKLKNNEK
ncbi:hypothetical protein N9015_01120 [Akkermansiaceae bacterium]|nr:hypothetical protein [Akkermansiaceae bacterium]